ncbi:unnamed protein product, partial [Timema podura]|nr:unnamed protein product [Timema podura]
NSVKANNRIFKQGEASIEPGLAGAVEPLCLVSPREVCVLREFSQCFVWFREGAGYNMSGEVGIRTSGVGPGTLSVEQDNFREILSKKQTLLLELRNYQGSAHFSNPAQGHTQDKQIINQEVGIIPAKTRLQTGISINMGKDHIPPHVEITLSTNNEMIIRAVLVFAEGIFKGETHVIHPKDSEVSSKLNVALFPQKDVPIDIHIKTRQTGLVLEFDSACAAQFIDWLFQELCSSNRYPIHELGPHHPNIKDKVASGTTGSVPCPLEEISMLPRDWSMFLVVIYTQFSCLSSSMTILISADVVTLVPSVTFSASIDVVEYAPESLRKDLEVSFELKVSFLSLRNNSELTVTMFPDGRLVINTEDIVLAGELIQSLAAFLNLEHVQKPTIELLTSCDLIESLAEFIVYERASFEKYEEKAKVLRENSPRGFVNSSERQSRNIYVGDDNANNETCFKVLIEALNMARRQIIKARGNMTDTPEKHMSKKVLDLEEGPSSFISMREAPKTAQTLLDRVSLKGALTQRKLGQILRHTIIPPQHSKIVCRKPMLALSHEPSIQYVDHHV